MSNNFIIFPMLAMVVLSFTTVVRLFFARTASVKKGSVEAGYFKTYQGKGEPERNQQLSRHFVNLFESPVLFYAVCISALAAHLATPLFQSLAWAYVVARILHAIVHTGSNKLPLRIAAYFSSWFILLGLWGLLSYNVILLS